MAANLKSRLARIKALGTAKAVDLEEPSVSGSVSRPRPDFLKGWKQRGEFFWSRQLRFDCPLPKEIDPALFAPLGKKRLRSVESGGRAPPPEAAERVASSRLRFFDLETTGLSGGTGTIAFLAAVGRAGEDGFELEQLFIEDFPGEKAFVLYLLDLLRDGVVVSYNGKAFDMPLLRTRCVMNAVPAPAPPHVDALFASRRLWKSVHGGASLELLGSEVLGLVREEDIPGSMIPETWLDYARTGESSLMHLVLAHNADDVVALARLVSRAQALFDEPRSALAARDLDRAGLGRSLLAAGREGEGEELLEAAAGDGDASAALFVMKRYRLAGRIADCLRIESLLPRDYRSAVEKAKLFERLVRDLGAARSWARVALELASGEEESQAAARRLRRIEGKLERGGSGD
jgi:uncharacterized protein